MRKVKIALLFAATALLFSTAGAVTVSDSLINAATKTESPAGRAALLLAGTDELSNAHRDSALTLLAQSLATAEDLGDERMIADVQLSIAALHLSGNNTALAFAPLQAAYGYYKKHNLNPQVAEAALLFNRYYSLNEDLKQCMAYTLEAQKIYEKNGDKNGLAEAYYRISLLFRKQDDFKKALEYRFKALPLMQQSSNYKGQAKILRNIASAYGELSWNDTTLRDSLRYYLNLAIAITEEHRLTDEQIGCLSIIVGENVRSGEYAAAIANCRKMLQIAHNQTGISPKYICTAHFKLADAYTELKDYDRAMFYADSALWYADNMDWNFYRMVAYERKYDIAERSHDYKNALEYYRLFKNFEDTLASLERTEAINELEKKYETEKKDRRIESLQKETQIKSLQLRQRNLLVGGIILGVIMLVAGGLFFYRQRILQKKNQMMDLEQRLLRTQMNPHFFFNALTSIQSYIRSGENNLRAGDYLAKFARLMRQILESSRHEFISVEEDIQTLKNYLDLQKIQEGKNFNYTINEVGLEAPDELLLPPMLSQPFIENAIAHGLSQTNSGLITVTYTQHAENELTITIEDNGQGMYSNTAGKDHKSRAMEITTERLALLKQQTKKQAGFYVSNITDNNGNIAGVRVTIHLPVMYK